MYQVRMKAYEGNDNYIFVSYAHRNADFVLPIVDNLYDLGYRVWFDEGIEASAEWPEYIEEHLSRAAVVVAFVTKDFVKSPNCRKEITYALNQSIPLICVMPEEVDLGKGLSLQLADQQQINLSSMKPEAFYQKIAEAEAVRSCRWKAEDGTVVKKHKSMRGMKLKNNTKKSMKLAGIFIVSIVAVFTVLILIDVLFPNLLEEEETAAQQAELWPREENHIWEEDASEASYCIGCGVQTGKLSGEQKELIGNWSENQISLGFSYASYFVPDGTVHNCNKLTLNLSISEVEGDPFCEWTIYMRDENGNWSRTAFFDMTEEMEKQAVDIPVTFDEPVTFTGILIGCNDDSADYTLATSAIFKDVEIIEQDTER